MLSVFYHNKKKHFIKSIKSYLPILKANHVNVIVRLPNLN